MTAPRRSLVARLRPAADGGFTLAELLIAIVISALLAGILLQIVISSQRSTTTSTQVNDLTAEARAALNRMSADLQEATPVTLTSGTVIPAVTAAANADGPPYRSTNVTSITFNLDANGDGCIAGVASKTLSPLTNPAPPPCVSTSTTDPSNPETETFCWIPPGQTGGSQLYLLATDPNTESTPVTSCGGGTPLLAGKVTQFEIYYRSSLYYYQNASTIDPQSGITTWYDLDDSGPPVGNDDGTLNAAELKYIDSVVINITMSQNGHSESFQTQVSMRNVHPNA